MTRMWCATSPAEIGPFFATAMVPHLYHQIEATTPDGCDRTGPGEDGTWRPTE